MTAPTMQIMSLRDLLENASDPEKPQRGIPEAQMMELTRRLASYAEMHEFEPGQFVQQKEGLASIDNDIVLCFTRYLDPDNPGDLAIMTSFFDRTASNKCDCLVAMLNDDGNSVMFVPHDSSRLEPMAAKEG